MSTIDGRYIDWNVRKRNKKLVKYTNIYVMERGKIERNKSIPRISELVLHQHC